MTTRIPRWNHDEVTSALRSDILDGTYAPGERLVELSLAERYDAGRAAIRSALVELATEGLVEREANRGASVRQIELNEAIQITEARSALESLLAAAAARNASGGERDELQMLELRMRESVDREAFIEYSDLNAILHRRIREISGHEVAGDLVALLRNRSARHQYRLALMPGRPAESLEQHAAIIRAIVRGDAASASAAMAAHLLSVIDVLRHWNDLPPDPTHRPMPDPTHRPMPDPTHRPNPTHQPDSTREPDPTRRADT